MIIGKKVQKQNIINQQYIINDNREKGTERKLGQFTTVSLTQCCPLIKLDHCKSLHILNIWYFFFTKIKFLSCGKI